MAASQVVVNTLLGREIPIVDIFENEDFGDELINENLKELQHEVKRKLKVGNTIEEQIVAYNNLGTAFYRLIRHDKAEVCFRSQLKLTKPVFLNVPFQNSHTINKKEQKNALVNLACIYHVHKWYQLALTTLKAALDLAEELGDEHAKARIFNNMANIYEDVLDIDSAVECLLKRLEIVTELGDASGQIKCAASLGSLYHLTGDIRESLMHYDKAVTTLQMISVKRQLDSFEAAAENQES